jgi:hypothetical protein
LEIVAESGFPSTLYPISAQLANSPLTTLTAMAKQTRKIWVGLGIAAVAGAAASHLGAQDAGHKSHAQPPPAQKGAAKPGEGGEAYLTDGGPRDTRVRFYRDIALMRGHLRIGGELVELDLWDEALPHFLHPTEELYGLVEKYIKLHSMQPFKRELGALAQAVKARRKGAHDQALKVVERRLDAALAVAKRFMTPVRTFTVRSAIEVLRTAQLEYEASMEGDRFTKPVEYQDSRGFVWQAERMLEPAVATDAVARDKTRAAFARLKAAWPSPMPPPKPVLEVGEISALISQIELATSGL